MNTTIPTITIGIDLGDKKHAICVLNEAGGIIEERFITHHRESIRRSSGVTGAAVSPEVGGLSDIESSGIIG